MKCPHCFAENPDSSVFCNQCGERMVMSTQTASDRTSAPSDETPDDPWAVTSAASLAALLRDQADAAEVEEIEDPWAASSAVATSATSD
jgi:hypothetical protein